MRSDEQFNDLAPAATIAAQDQISPMRLFLLALLAALCSAPCMTYAQSAVLVGRVVEDSTSRPVAGAQIVIGTVTKTAISDSSGAFILSDVPVGLYTVLVRAVGFTPFEQRLVFRSGERIDLDIVIKRPGPALTRVDVMASAVPVFLKAFDARRQLGQGRFLDTTDIAPFADSQLPSLLTARLSGVRQIRYGGRTALASGRGVSSLEKSPAGDLMDRQLGAPRSCYVQVIIDDIVLYQGQPDEPLFNADQVNLRAVAAIEYYTPSNRPSEFKRAGGGACGTLVLWTRR